MSRAPITSYEADVMALNLLKGGLTFEGSGCRSQTFVLPNARRRVILASAEVRDALDEHFAVKDTREVRIRVSIPDYVDGQGFVPHTASPAIEVYSIDGKLLQDPIALTVLGPRLGMAVKWEITDRLHEAERKRPSSIPPPFEEHALNEIDKIETAMNERSVRLGMGPANADAVLQSCLLLRGYIATALGKAT